MKDFYKKNKLTQVINVSGFMTKIGASITNKKSIEAANNIFPYFVNIDELQAIASKRISKYFNSEAALVTAFFTIAFLAAVVLTADFLATVFFAAVFLAMVFAEAFLALEDLRVR